MSPLLEFVSGYFPSAGCLVIEVFGSNRDSLLFSQLSALSAGSDSHVFMVSKVLESSPSGGSRSLHVLMRRYFR